MDYSWINGLQNAEFVDEDLVLTKFDTFANSLYEDLKKAVIEEKNKRKKEEEKVSLVKKNIERAKQNSQKATNKLMQIEGDRRTLHTEMKVLEKRIENIQIQNSLLVDEIDISTEELERLRKVRKDAQEQAVKMFKALVAAMSYFKGYLKCYINVDNMASSEFSFHYFCDHLDKPLNECNYYVILKTRGKDWQVVDMKPSVPCQEEIIDNLKRTSDIVTFIGHVQDLYREHKSKSNK